MIARAIRLELKTPMTESEESGPLIRSLAYFILATLAAVATGLFTTSTDLLSLFLLWLPIALLALALFELGFFLYRRSRSTK